jgi:hypothetical protein
MDDLETGTGRGQDTTESVERGRIRLASIDHEEYDALADLFLGDGELAPQGFDAHEQSVEPSEPTHSTHTPVLQLTRHEEDAELLADQVESVVHEGVLDTLGITQGHASELLAELLGEVGSDIETGPNSGDRLEVVEVTIPRVEVVLLGHLPVRATLWARQYACHRAQETGESTALIRAASGSMAVDLIGDAPKMDSALSLGDALGRVCVHADRVILRVDESCEPELLDRDEVDEITILTGADEAAVVASYRLIKALDVTLAERFGVEDGPQIRVAVMGARREQAIDACTKLQNAVETFIERQVEIVMGSGRIDATATTSMYRDTVSHRGSAVLDGLLRAGRGLEEDEEIGEGLIEESNEEVVGVEFPASGVSVPVPKVQSEAQPKRAENEPALMPQRQATESPRIREGLCAMIPGLRAIEARCPKAPGVELGVDEDGRLHLLVCDEDTRDAMNRLLAAQVWARNNLGLLIRAEGSLSAPSADRDEDTDAAMHLISPDPAGVREIYDTSVRVYSLARVRVGNVIAQVATPIN